MAGEVAIGMSQLQAVVSEVRKTKKTQTVHLADGVVAVVKPEKRPATYRPERRLPKTTASRRKTYSLESAFGAVKGSGGPRDFDQMIREAKDERADRFLANL